MPALLKEIKVVDYVKPNCLSLTEEHYSKIEIIGSFFTVLSLLGINVFGIFRILGYSWFFWPYFLGFFLILLMSFLVLVLMILTIFNMRALYKSSPDIAPPNWKVLIIFSSLIIMMMGQQVLKIQNVIHSTTFSCAGLTEEEC